MLLVFEVAAAFVANRSVVIIERGTNRDVFMLTIVHVRILFLTDRRPHAVAADGSGIVFILTGLNSISTGTDAEIAVGGILTPE